MVSIDDLKNLIQQQKSITIEKASDELDLPKTQIEKWAELLKDEGMQNKKGVLTWFEKTKELEGGKIYLVDEESNIDVYAYFNDKKYKTKLLITRNNPKKIVKDKNLVNTEVFWLTNVSKDDKCINPNNLVDIEGFLEKKFEDKKKSLLVIENINFIIEFNDFKEVLHVLQHIRDVLSDTEDTLIIKINKKGLDDKEFAQIKAECEELK